MPRASLDAVIRHITSLVVGQGDVPDGELLDAFVVRADQAAFAALTRRHGPMVLAVCRRILQLHDAEDSFQATFIILARQAAALTKKGSLGGWLHRVAQRIALQAHRADARRQKHERQSFTMSAVNPAYQAAWREIQVLLDEEIQRLPEKYREPFIVCCLENQSCAAAAGRLRLKETTVSSRLAEARRRLQKRLLGRGVSLTAALRRSALASDTVLAAALAAKTVAAATVPTCVISMRVAALVSGMTRCLMLQKAKLGVMLFLALSATVGVTGVGASRLLRAGEEGVHEKNDSVPPVAVRQASEVKKKLPLVDLYGDPLPEGAIRRLGTLRQRAPASRLAVTADGKDIIAVTDNLTIRRFDALTGKLRATQHFPGDRTRVGWSWVSPRGTFLLTFDLGAENRQLEVWELTTGKRTQTLSLAQVLVRQATFSANEAFVAIVVDLPANNLSKQILVWDLKRSKSKALWTEISKRTTGPYPSPVLALSPNGDRLAAVFPDKTLRCWDVQKGELLWQTTTSGNSVPFFSPDGHMVLSASEDNDGGIKGWHARMGKAFELKHQPPKEAVALIGFVPNSPYVAFETDSENVVLWDPDTAKVALRLPAPQAWASSGWKTSPAKYTYVFTPDGKGLVRASGALQRWDLTNGKIVYADTENWGHTAAILRLVFSQDGTLLAYSSVDQTARVWDVSTARSLHVFPKDQTHHVAFTPDGKFFFVRPKGNDLIGLRKWNLATGLAEQDYQFPDQPGPHPLTYSKELRVTADGKRILMTNARWDGGYKTWLTTWDALGAKCVDHKNVPWTMESVLTADGRGVVAFDAQTGTVSLLDVTTGQPRLQFATDRNALQRPQFCDLTLSPSGRLMAAHVSFIGKGELIDDLVRIGDMSTGRQIVKLPISRPVANQKTSGDCFAFSADDRLLAANAPGGVRLWEIASWQEIGCVKDTSAFSAGRIFQSLSRLTAVRWRRARTIAPYFCGTPPFERRPTTAC